MDGVLFDTERISTECCFWAADELGISISREAVYGCFGLSGTLTREFIVRTMEPQYPGGSFPYDAYSKKWSEGFSKRLEEEVPMMPGVVELLDYLEKKGIKAAIASSTRRERVLSNLEKNGLQNRFAVIISGDMVQNGKPAPDIYRKACRELGVACREAMAVEDSPNGIRSAHAAGLYTVMVPNMVMPGPELEGLYDLTCTESIYGRTKRVKDFSNLTLSLGCTRAKRADGRQI